MNGHIKSKSWLGPIRTDLRSGQTKGQTIIKTRLDQLRTNLGQEFTNLGPGYTKQQASLGPT